MSRRSTAVLAVVLAFAFNPRHAAAYLDPGTGSIVYQAMLGTTLAATAAIRIYWRGVRELVSRLRRRRERREEG